jgi:Flp pilus assembly pilin Flp
MMKRIYRAARAIGRDQGGQVTTEYLLIVVIVIVVAVAAFNLFNKGIVGYYQRITMVASLPVP